MPGEDHRSNIALGLTVALLDILLEEHVVSRPTSYLLTPFVVMFSFYLARVPIRKRGWLIASLLSLAGFVLTKFVFK